MNTYDDTRTGVGTTVAASHRRAARAGVWFSMASAALALTTACGGSTSSTSSASTATSMPVQTQSATDNGGSATATDTSTTTGTSTATTTTTATSTVTSTATTTTSATSSPTTSASARIVVDDPARYTLNDRLVFTSPTGVLHCGIDSTGTGCQSSQKVANLPACNDPEGSKGPLVMFQNGRAVADCTSQGVFMVQGAKVLPYGHSLTAQGVTCTSQSTGVYCIDNTTQRSLFASRGYFGAGH